MGHQDRTGRATVAISVLACLLAVASGARANGAFPMVSQLLADPAAPEHLVLRSTFGLLSSTDAGGTWDWLCEAGMGYKDLEPPMAVLPGGTILLAIPNGISRSDPSGCDFALAAGIDVNVVDLSRVPDEPGAAIAVSLVGTESQLWWSSDEGASFAPLGEPFHGLIAYTLDSAASNADVIYVSGILGTQGVLLRSRDRGETFETFSVPNTTTGRRPYIAAVDPMDENTVYVRLIGVQGVLQMTRDGGETFTTILETALAVQGFALSPDGRTVLAGNTYDGMFRASTKDFEFEKLACGGRSCLSWNDAGLFGCGDDVVDGYIVGRSDDQGETFERVVDLSCIRGPLACADTTSIGAVCPAAWAAIQLQLGATECMPRDVPPYTGCFDGEGGAAASSGGSGGTPAKGGQAGRDAGAGGATEAESDGCGCRVAQRADESGAVGLVMTAAWLAGRRRRHARRAGRRR